MTDETVTISKKLTDKLIYVALAIGGYMVIWGIGDARFKGQVITDLQNLHHEVQQLDTRSAERDERQQRQIDENTRRLNGAKL